MKGTTMNQTIKDEIKVITVAATLENGTSVIQKLKDLPEFLTNEMDRVSDDQIFSDIKAYSNITEQKPEDIGYEFLQATRFFSGTSVGEYIEIQKGEIDKTFINSINDLEDQDFDDIDAYEKSELARLHLVRMIKSYQDLTTGITDVINTS
jgi:hypothetical protein